MSENNGKKTQGSLQSALKGEYSIDLKSTFQEAWQLTKADKSSIVQGMLVVLCIAIMVLLLANHISQQKGIEWEDPGFRFGLDLVMAILLAPLTAALMMMGIRSSVGIKNKTADLFGFINRTLVITVTVIMTTALVQIGILFFILPGLYLMIATGFAIPLVLEKKLLPTKAIFTSIMVVNYQWKNFVKLYALFFAVLASVAIIFMINIVLGAILLCVSMIWLAPLYYNIKGILYRDIFGVGDSSVEMPEENRSLKNQQDSMDQGSTEHNSGNRDDHFNA